MSPLDERKLHSQDPGALPSAPGTSSSPGGPRRPVERFASYVEGGEFGRESAFRESRRRRVARHRQAAGATKTAQRSVLSPAVVAGVGRTALTSGQAAQHTRELQLHRVARHGSPCTLNVSPGSRCYGVPLAASLSVLAVQTSASSDRSAGKSLRFTPEVRCVSRN